MRLSKKWVGSIALAIAGITAFSASQVLASENEPMLNGKFVPQPPPLTQAQRNKIGSGIQEIVTPTGVFNRVSSPGNFSASQIVKGKSSLYREINNAKIQEIILSYGVFVRGMPPQKPAG